MSGWEEGLREGLGTVAFLIVFAAIVWGIDRWWHSVNRRRVDWGKWRGGK